MTCKIDGCERSDKMSKGYCARHYENFRSTGNPLSKREQDAAKPPTPCAIDSCDRVVKSRGWCGRHYENWRQTGSPVPARDLSLDESVRTTGWTETGSGCWEWNGPRNEHGYGLINLSRAGVSNARAHRIVYEMTVGEISSSAILRHSCDNPPCVNPDHLTPGTHDENMRDMAERGRSGTSHEARGGRCPNGHDVTAPGSYKMVIRPGGASYRSCIECDKARKRRHSEKARQVTGSS